MFSKREFSPLPSSMSMFYVHVHKIRSTYHVILCRYPVLVHDISVILHYIISNVVLNIILMIFAITLT